MLLSEVPVEVLLDHILPALPLSALLALTCTSKFFALVCSDDTFWKLKLHRDYNFTPNADTARETGWKLIYRGIRKPSVYTWGAAGQGRLGLRSLPRGHNFGVPYPVKVDINARIVSLVAGGWCFYALDDQGHLRVWGQMDGDAFALQSDGFSEASKKAKTPHRLQISYPNSGSGAVKFSAVSCARSISAALDSQSNVWIFTNWGRPVLLTSPLVSSGLTESGPRDPENTITQVECGWDFVSMLTRGGSAYVIWPTGQQSQFASLLNSQNTQLNNEGDATKGHPQEVDGEDVIPCTTIAIQADPLRLPALPRDLPDLSRQFSVAESGVSGAEPTGYGREVDPRNKETRLVRIAAGDCFIIGLTNKGHVLSLDVTGGASNGPEWLRINWMRQGWVYLPEYCELEKVKQHQVFREPSSEGNRLEVPTKMRITHISAHFQSFVAYSVSATVSPNSSLVLLGKKTDNDVVTFDQTIYPKLLDQSIISLVFGDYHSVALTSTGKLLSWGAFSNGALGLGDPGRLAIGAPGGYPDENHRLHRREPSRVEVPSEIRFDWEGDTTKKFVVSVAAGGWHTGALVIDLELPKPGEKGKEIESESSRPDERMDEPQPHPEWHPNPANRRLPDNWPSPHSDSSDPAPQPYQHPPFNPHPRNDAPRQGPPYPLPTPPFIGSRGPHVPIRPTQNDGFTLPYVRVGFAGRGATRGRGVGRGNPPGGNSGQAEGDGPSQ